MKLLKLKDPVIKQEYNNILVIINKATKQGYFVLYIKEMFVQHRAPMKIILDQDLRFVAVFWEAFIAKQRTQIATLTVYHL